ncbi:SLATT domain-containing protein [Bacillus infantis]|uniref:SLATT domain-containing protein n=1 Tax=Bacillus infantis TaxID=324767 RepID=UPI0020A217AF|nr:SLATT domain-containing protein [Bacillus infantis]MCP1156995.1 SLATT domain-containing protein [Bacillus infantis]
MVQQPNRDGEISLEQNFHPDHKTLLEAQIRECYGRVVYSHKTHEKCADILLKRNNHIKVWQLVLSAITTGSFLATILGNGNIAAIVGTVISTILLILNAYTKDFELVSVAEEHRNAANNIWIIREDYLSLITDLKDMSPDELIKRRDFLQKELSEVYKGSPRTNFKAYEQARDALKNNEELTFSEDEIDLLLPKQLRKFRE